MPGSPEQVGSRQMRPRLLPLTDAERAKLLRKLLPRVRRDSIIDYAHEGRHCSPPIDGRTVKEVIRRYLAGETWGKTALKWWGKACYSKHEPLRVKRQAYDLMRDNPELSRSKCAAQLGIKKSTFFDIMRVADEVPGSATFFSQDNKDFGPLYVGHLSLPRVGETFYGTFFSLTHFGVVARLLALVLTGVRVVILIDKSQAMGTYELPCIRRLLDGGAEVYAQKGSKVQHQKMTIVGNFMSSTGSANPSQKGLEASFENITYHFEPAEIDAAVAAVEKQVAHHCEPVTYEWLDAREAKLDAKRQLQIAKASEGMTAEEMAAKAYRDDEADKAMAEERRELAHQRKLKSAEKGRRKRRAERLCLVCSSPLLPSVTTFRCPACLRRRNDREAMKMARGQCRSCSKPKDGGHSYCRECLQRRAALQLAKTKAKQRPGMCSTCSKEPVKDNPAGGTFKLCATCLQGYQQRRARRYVPGNCSKCFRRKCAKKKNGDLYSRCNECRVAQNENDRKRYKRLKDACDRKLSPVLEVVSL